MRVLVTNDDGIDSVGIQRLALALARDERFDVVVVAPDGDRSGTGASLGSSDPSGISAQRVRIDAAPALEAWALDGTPALCVLASRLGAFGEPADVVVSGINAGLNTGRAILHSGTVGAVLTAQNFGLSGLAVSLQSGDTWEWDTAAELAAEVIDMVLSAPSRSAVNLNVPARPRADVAGLRWARLAPFGEVRMMLTAVDEDAADPADARRRLTTELQLAEVEFDPDTDTGLVRAGYASLTTLVGVVEAWPGYDSAVEFADAERIHASLAPGADVHESHQVPDADSHGNLRRPIIGV
jgi:5'-nucleotidase